MSDKIFISYIKSYVAQLNLPKPKTELGKCIVESRVFHEIIHSYVTALAINIDSLSSDCWNKFEQEFLDVFKNYEDSLMSCLIITLRDVLVLDTELYRQFKKEQKGE